MLARFALFAVRRAALRASASVCGAAGEDVYGEPQVAFTTDGGQTWTDPTPASWPNATWITTSIDCVSARTCWLTGLNGPFGDVVERRPGLRQPEPLLFDHVHRRQPLLGGR